MRFNSRFLFVLILIVVLVGCAHRVYTIGVDTPERGSGLSAGAKVNVKKLPDRVPFDHDANLERKMNRILEEQGFEVVEAEFAEYFVLYEYRITARETQMKLELLRGAMEGMRTVRRGGPYIHVLELHIVGAPLYRSNRYADSLVWEGGAVLGDVPTTSPKFHDLLLVAAFDRLGERNLDGGFTRMTLNDPDARRLRQN